MKELWSKIKEALISALPITAIVYIMALTPLFDFSQTELITFTVSAVLLVLGIGLFNLGAFLHVADHTAREFAIALGLIVVEREIRDKVLNAIYKEMGMAKAAQGIAFSLPVSDAAGLAPAILPKDKEKE